MAFILGILLSWPVFFGLIIAALVFEHNEASGWTVLITLAMALVAFFMFQLSWVQLGVILGAWVPIGLVWSIWRWKRYCAKVVEKVKSGSMPADRGKDSIDPQQALSKITQWVIAWPFSLIESILGDVFDAIQGMVKGVFRKTYEKISTKALVEIEQHEA